jgi:predicted enzyme related to lactoylglutathione lyase
MIKAAHFILYVEDQRASTAFYAEALGISPRLDVPGMTEFDLGDNSVLGLMPIAGVNRLFGADLVTRPADSHKLNAELYLIVDDPLSYHERILRAGARELSPLSERDWGHMAAYSADPDCNIVAFGRAIE